MSGRHRRRDPGTQTQIRHFLVGTGFCRCKSPEVVSGPCPPRVHGVSWVVTPGVYSSYLTPIPTRPLLHPVHPVSTRRGHPELSSRPVPAQTQTSVEDPWPTSPRSPSTSSLPSTRVWSQSDRRPTCKPSFHSTRGLVDPHVLHQTQMTSGS